MPIEPDLRLIYRALCSVDRRLLRPTLVFIEILIAFDYSWEDGLASRVAVDRERGESSYERSEVFAELWFNL